MREDKFPSARRKLIYITGYGRSGSTLLDIALGSQPRVFGMGELTALARHVWKENEYCACGAQVRDCQFWSQVVARMENGDDGHTGHAPTPLAGLATLQNWMEPLVSPLRWLGRMSGSVSAYREATSAMLDTIAEQSGAEDVVLLDSSKLPGRGLALAGMANVDLYVVHLVRDARAVAHSLSRGYKRQVEAGLQRELTPKPAIYTAMRWLSVNVVAAWLSLSAGKGRKARVRYEDFVENPEGEMHRIMSSLSGLSIRTEGTTAQQALRPSHQVAGSRHRMQDVLVIRADEKWQREMPAGKYWLVTILTAPLLILYNYPLRIERRREGAAVIEMQEGV